MTPQNNPTINPARTSNNVCCFTMMRAVPSIPDSKMKKQSHDTGLKLKIRLYDNRPPTIMPLLATFPFEVYHNADDHADECGYNDARHIAWQMNLVHRKQAGYIADNG